MKISNSLTKKVFYCLIPLIILFVIELMDNFKNLKLLVLVVNGNKGTATIVDNPFYKLSKSEEFLNKNGDFDSERFEEFLRSKGILDKKYIKFEYFDGAKIYTDSLHYNYHVDYGSDPETGSYYSEWVNQLSEFMPTINTEPIGYKFDIIYFKDLSYPEMVVYESKKHKEHHAIIRNFIFMWGLGILISGFIFTHYFILRN